MRPLTLLADVVKNRLGAVTRPRFVTWLATLRCNATCGACDSWRLPKQTELTADQAGAIFEDLGPLDAVRISGGEPTLRTDLAQLADAVWRGSRPGVLHLTTHGGFPDRVLALAEGFAAPRRLRILVSLDGMAEEHDRSRGKSVSFARATETIRRLVELRGRGVRVSVNHTIVSNASLADGPALQKLFAPLGVDVQAVVAYEASATYGLSLQGKKAEQLIPHTGYPLHPALDREGTLRFVEASLRDLGSLRDPATRLGKRYYLRGLAARLRNQEDARPRPPCVALRSHLRILPDGSVPVCQFNNEKVGNLAEQSAAEIWSGERARVARAWVSACPGCWAECEVMPNAIYSGDILRA